MIRTLHWYLGKDLFRVTMLSLVGFTLVMTVFAIVEPMRRQGLSSDQVLGLFGYTIPVMLTLTAPVAALFATTIVYGRFSQDNEMTACRASGIATLNILMPALTLGLAVTIVTLALSNFVTPQLASLGEKAVRADLRKISYHQLRAQSYIKLGGFLVHADAIDDVNDMLLGVIVADFKKPQDIRLIVAGAAKVNFYERDKEWFIGVQLFDSSITQTARKDIIDGRSVGREALQIPSNFAKEKISIYNWDQLMETLDKPFDFGDIQYSLRGIKRRLYHGLLAKDVVAAINAGRPYEKLTDGHDVYRVTAAGATIDEHGAVQLSSAPGKPVKVTVLRKNKEVQTIQADRGEVEARWSAVSNSSLVSLWLGDNVVVRVSGEREDEARRRTEWMIGQMEMPPDLVQKNQAITPDSIYQMPVESPADQAILNDVKTIRTDGVAKILGAVYGEIHSRLAYGTSCFLLVAMGAALGLLFRGGQILSAFAISVVPSTVVIVMMIMGKTMLSNPSIPMVAGIASIWSGIGLLVVANLFIYAKLVRM